MSDSARIALVVVAGLLSVHCSSTSSCEKFLTCKDAGSDGSAGSAGDAGPGGSAGGGATSGGAGGSKADAAVSGGAAGSTTGGAGSGGMSGSGGSAGSGAAGSGGVSTGGSASGGSAAGGASSGGADAGTSGTGGTAGAGGVVGDAGSDAQTTSVMCPRDAWTWVPLDQGKPAVEAALHRLPSGQVVLSTKWMVVPTAGRVRYGYCSDSTCSDLSITDLDAQARDMGSDVSVTHGSDDLPFLAYLNSTDGVSRVAKCDAMPCTNDVNYRATILGETTHVDVARSSTGQPIMAAVVAGVAETWICVNDCRSFPKRVTLGSGTLAKVAPANNGFNLTVWSAPEGLRVARCNDAACNTFSNTQLDAGGAVDALALEVPSDGLPVIAFRRGSALNVYKCADAQCLAHSSSNLAGYTPGGGEPALSVVSNLRPVAMAQASGGLDLIECSDASCQDSHVERIVDGAFGAFALDFSSQELLALISDANGLSLGRCSPKL